MFELRWVYRQSAVRTTVLQYRQQIDVNVYAGLGPWPVPAPRNLQWSEWRDVPVVQDDAPV